MTKKTEAKLRKEAQFLLNWSKGKPLQKVQNGSRFWSNGKYMVQVDQKTIEGMVELGLCRVVRERACHWKKERTLEQLAGLQPCPPPDVIGAIEIVLLGTPQRKTKEQREAELD